MHANCKGMFYPRRVVDKREVLMHRGFAGVVEEAGELLKQRRLFFMGKGVVKDGEEEVCVVFLLVSRSRIVDFQLLSTV